MQFVPPFCLQNIRIHSIDFWSRKRRSKTLPSSPAIQNLTSTASTESGEFPKSCCFRQNTDAKFGAHMFRRVTLASAILLVATLIPFGRHIAADEPVLAGFSAQSSRVERGWEEKFRAMPDQTKLREYMQRLTARPHNVGSPYDKDNAEWLLAKFKEFGFDAHIESFNVLFPTPKERLIELVEGGPKFTAKLQEPPVSEDPTSDQQSEQLPTYNAYSADGDVTGPIVYVNYG